MIAQINTMDFLKKIYNLYPKEISPLWDIEKYRNQSEHKTLVELISKKEIFPEEKKEKLIDDLKNLYNLKVEDFSLFSWNDRAYNLQSLLSREELVCNVLCINISVIIPSYTIYILKTERENMEEFKLKYPPTLNDSLLEKYSDLIGSVESLLENQYNLKKFPNNLKDKIISNVGFQDIGIGKFTFFNAFFLDSYRHTKYF